MRWLFYCWFNVVNIKFVYIQVLLWLVKPVSTFYTCYYYYTVYLQFY